MISLDYQSLCRVVGRWLFLNRTNSRSNFSDILSPKSINKNSTPYVSKQDSNINDNILEVRQVSNESAELQENADKNMFTEYTAGESHSLPMVTTQDNWDIEDFRDKESDGIYIIFKGKCIIANPFDQFIPKILFKYDLFGENDMLRINGYQSFGDIITMNNVEWLFLSKQSISRIPFYEQFIIKQYLSNRSDLIKLNYTCSQRYGVHIETVINN